MIGGPYAYLAAAIGVALAVGAAYVKGRGDGATIERAAWVERDNAAVREANAAIDAAHKKAREAEKQSAEKVAAVSRSFQTELKNAKTAADRLRDRLATDRLVRDATAGRGEAGGSGLSAPGAGARGCDGPPADRLDRKDGEFLVLYAEDSLRLAKQLIACQAIVAADRK